MISPMPLAPEAGTALTAGMSEDVARGLRQRQKELPSKYFYDALGSRLFEAICELPEYGLTRAESRLLAQYAGEMTASVGEGALVCELGSGTGKKTRYLLEAMARRAELVGGGVRYFPVEISGEALRACERELGELDRVVVEGIAAEYLEGLRMVAARRDQEPLLVLFLGSTYGNFRTPEDVEFLAEVAAILRPGDRVLLGADLVKEREVLVAAYDDGLGVTAAFNKNVLVRINEELGADFRLDRFAHEARWNSATGSIEMHLRSERRQVVRVPGIGMEVEFREGETIWTENSHKFGEREIEVKGGAAGLVVEGRWVEKEWGFAEYLLGVRE